MKLIQIDDKLNYKKKNKMDLKPFLRLGLNKNDLRSYFIYIALNYYNNYFYVYEHLDDFISLEKEEILRRVNIGKTKEKELNELGITLLTYFDIGSEIIFCAYLVLFTKGNINLLTKRPFIQLFKVKDLKETDEEWSVYKDKYFKNTAILLDYSSISPSFLKEIPHKIIVSPALNSSLFNKGDLLISAFYTDTINEYVVSLNKQLSGFLHYELILDFEKSDHLSKEEEVILLDLTLDQNRVQIEKAIKKLL